MNNGKSGAGALASIGIVSAFAFVIIWLVAIISDPSWSFGENLVSDLATAEGTGIGSAFKFATVIFGFIFAVYGIAICLRSKGALSYGGALLAAASLVMAVIGFVAIDLIFTFLAVFAMVGLAIGRMKEGKRLVAVAPIAGIALTLMCYCVGSLEMAESVALLFLIATVFMEALGFLLCKE